MREEEMRNNGAGVMDCGGVGDGQEHKATQLPETSVLNDSAATKENSIADLQSGCTNEIGDGGAGVMSEGGNGVMGDVGAGEISDGRIGDVGVNGEMKGQGTNKKSHGGFREKSKRKCIRKREGNVEVWIKDLELYINDYEVLTSTRWLNDQIIYAAQSLLCEQSKGQILGWKSTQCSKRANLFPKLPADCKYVQILNVSGCHWATVSNMKVPGDGIFWDSTCIYDSLFSSVSNDTMNQICSFVLPKCSSMRFDLMNTQIQENVNDCGLFAIAYATELVFGHDPCVTNFKTEVMRSHLIKCLKNHKMESFPKRRRTIGFGENIRKSRIEKIYCYCHMPNDKKLAMVLCSMCSKWFHTQCITGKVSNDPKKKWYCSICQSMIV